MDSQATFLDEHSPAAAWEREATRRALDELFRNTARYSSSGAYQELLDFVSGFRSYSPYNAMLVNIQMRGARYVAPASRWYHEYKRRIRPGARPLVILQPMGPVMFVFDVSDTEPEEGAPKLPAKVTDPFQVHKGAVRGELAHTIENAMRDGIEVTEQDAGSQSAGLIRTTERNQYLAFLERQHPKPQYVRVLLRYELLLNKKHSAEVRYATLTHELAHLYCGHLGTPNPKWWPDRRGLSPLVVEFEAESISYLVCRRLGIHSPSAEYLAGYVRDHQKTPEISLDCVMKVAGAIEQMGRKRLPPRKEEQ